MAVDGDVGIGHDTFKVEEHGVVTPVGGSGEGAPVDAVDAGEAPWRSDSPVGVNAEALQFPVGWDTDGGPFASMLALVGLELPLDRVVLA